MLIIWLALLFLVIATSAILAFRSMKDYQEIPSPAEDYGVFLIQNPAVLNKSLLDALHYQIVKKGQVLSLERLFKGDKSALVVFGPKNVLLGFQDLNLLELEDYCNLDFTKMIAWEVGLKDKSQINSIFGELPTLGEDEQFWWQQTMQAKKDLYFQTQIRAVVYSLDSKNRKQLSTQIQSLGTGRLAKVPRPYTSTQIMENYQQRSLVPFLDNPVLLSSEDLLRLLGRE